MTLGDHEKHEAMLRAPQGAQWYANARYYKKGVHFKLFVWSSGEWRATTANPFGFVMKPLKVLG